MIVTEFIEKFTTSLERSLYPTQVRAGRTLGKTSKGVHALFFGMASVFAAVAAFTAVTASERHHAPGFAEFCLLSLIILAWLVCLMAFVVTRKSDGRERWLASMAFIVAWVGCFAVNMALGLWR